MLNKKSPIGVDDFAKLLDKQNNYFFVDKSLFIKEIIDDKSEVTLITRPRRWGKSLNMSMLEYFFATEIPEINNQGLFDDLYISQVDGGRYMQHNRQYPVIFLSLKALIRKTFNQQLIKHEN